MFYQGQVLLEFDYSSLQEASFEQWRRGLLHGDPAVYQGALFYRARQKTAPYLRPRGPSPGWYRMDLSPELEEHVPKELRTLVLLMS